MDLIILSAGMSNEVDGFPKLKLKYLNDSSNILDKYLNISKKLNPKIIIGYNALSIVNSYPNLKYTLNNDWMNTGSAGSLAIGLANKPVLILPCDLFLSNRVLNFISENLNGDYIISLNKENKKKNSLSVETDNGIVKRVYRGKSKTQDTELTNIYVINNLSILSEWKKRCSLNKEGYAGEFLPYDMFDIKNVIFKETEIYEINTVHDYLAYIN